MSEDTQLPRADSAERYCIGCLVKFPDEAGELFELLTASDFFDPEHSKIFAAAQRQFTAGGIDPVLLGRAVGGATTLVDLGINPHNAPVTKALIPIEAAKIVEARKKRQRFDELQSLATHSLNGYSSQQIDESLEAALYDWKRDSQCDLVLPKVSSIESRSVDWAWLGYLHRGGLTLLDGDPERGKSQISCDVAARWSYPRPFPFMQGDHFRNPGNVLMVATEDGASTTVRPRLEAAGANLDRVFLWPEDADFIKLPSGIDILAAAVKQHDISLLIIDPLGAHLDETINANRDSEVRRALSPLVALAQETNMAVIGVRHLNKDESKSAMYRGGGSIAFTAAARVVWAVGSDPNDQGRMIMAVLKSNIGKKPPALSYSIESHETTSRIRWEGESTCTVSDIFNRKQQRGGKTSDAKSLLKELLANGPLPESEVWEACESANIREWPYKQARKQLKVISSKGSMREGWLLSLPEGEGFDEEEGQDANTQ